VKIAAIYTRVSSDRQKEAQTIESQVSALKEYAAEQEYSVPDEWCFKDDGYSGAYLNRPGLERLRDLSAEGQIERVLIYSPDRLSRKYAYQVLLMEEFKRVGVEVIFIKSPKATTPEEELLLQFQGMIAEYERAQIIERSRRGKKYQAKLGNVNVLSRAPCGYKYIKKTEHSNAMYEIVEERAEIVRQIFQAYTQEDKPILGIARWLNQRGIATSTGKGKWVPRTIQNILRNPAYKGQAAFGRREYIRDFKGRRWRWRGKPAKGPLTRLRPQSEWIHIPVPVIISTDMFELAQERLQKNKHFAKRNTKVTTLLQSLIVCASCGYAVYRVSGPNRKNKKGRLQYYRCSRSERWRMGVDKACSNRPIRQDYLDELVWSEVMKLLENPELIRAEINRRSRQAQQSSPIQVRKDILIKEQIRIKKGIDNLLDAYQEGLLPLSQLRQRIPDLTKRKTTLKAELESLEMNFLDQQQRLDLADNLEGLLEEVLISPEGITIKHCIPITQSLKGEEYGNYQLHTQRQCCYTQGL